MMNKKILWVIAIIWLFSPLKVIAQEGSLNYNITPVFPESQAEDNKSYFDLILAPGEKETIYLKLQNLRQEPIELEVTAHTAFTNVTGVVEYGADAEETDPTLPYELSNLIEGPQDVSLAANETKTVAFDLHMPKEEFDGVLAGGMRISEVKNEQGDNVNDEEGMEIKNEFAYVVGVVVGNSRSYIQPSIDLLNVFADQLNGRNVISATIQNFTPTFVNQLGVEASVLRVVDNEILYEASKEMMQMAPNSHFHFPISLDGDRFQSGEYILKLKATSGEENWEWERQFSIETDEARTLNRMDVTIDTSPNWWMIGTILLCVILIGVIFYILLSNRQRLIERK